MELQKLIEGKTAMMEDKNNKLSSMMSGLKGERLKEEIKANKIWDEETKFLETLYEGFEVLSVLSVRIGNSLPNELQGRCQ